jgi:hypothetical protein
MLSALGACGAGDAIEGVINNIGDAIEDAVEDAVDDDIDDDIDDNSVPFTTVQDIRPSTTVRFEGSSQELTATSDEGVVTAVSDLTDFQSDASARLTYNEDRALIGLTARSAGDTEVTFTESEIEQPGERGFYTAEKEDETAVGIAASARSLGWNYQSFGGWLIAIGFEEFEEEVVVQTVGAISPPSGVPMTGTATYEGLSAGVYTVNSGALATVSDVEAVVDFATRSIDFMTTGTQVNDISTPIVENEAMPALDMTGTLEYEAGSNQFTGPVETTGGMRGTASGVFYGPAAEEIGGTFATQGTGVEAYIGGFGAAQPAAE